MTHPQSVRSAVYRLALARGISITGGFAAAVAESPFWSASGAAIPALVDEPKDIEHATSLVSIGVYSGIFLGPAIGGVLVGYIGPNWIFAANLASFLISALLIWSIQVRRAPDVVRSRVVAAMDGAQNISLGVGFAVAGPLVRALGPHHVYVIAGVGALFGTAVLWPLRRRVIESTVQRNEVQT